LLPLLVLGERDKPDPLQGGQPRVAVIRAVRTKCIFISGRESQNFNATVLRNAIAENTEWDAAGPAIK